MTVSDFSLCYCLGIVPLLTVCVRTVSVRSLSSRLGIVFLPVAYVLTVVLVVFVAALKYLSVVVIFLLFFIVLLLCLVFMCGFVVVFVDPNTKRFKRTLIYFNTDTQYANIWGNPLCQATKRHLNNR